MSKAWLRHLPLALAVVVAVVVTIDPHPFATVDGSPWLSVAVNERITPATATTMPKGTFVSPVVTTLPPEPTTTLPPSTTTPPPVDVTASPVPVTEPAPAPPPTAPAVTAPAPPPSQVAVVNVEVVPVWKSSTERAAAFSLTGTSEFGGPRVFLVKARDGDWLRVALPLRPNGSEGWVRARDVHLVNVDDRIEVGLANRALRWYRGSTLLLETTVAVGAPSSPTPPGSYYVTDRIQEAPSGPYGAWILALNGYSESFTTFDGGDPRLAIHGTNNPASLGAAASAGCVRVNADDLAALATGVPLGTPVTIS